MDAEAAFFCVDAHLQRDIGKIALLPAFYGAP